MELGSDSSVVLASFHDCTANLSPPNGAAMVSSSNTLNSATNDGSMPASVSPQCTDSEEKNFNASNAPILQELYQESTENGDLEALKHPEVTLQQTCNENDFLGRQCNDSEGTAVMANLEPVSIVADDQAGRLISAEKVPLPSADKTPQKVRPAENARFTRNMARRQTFYMIRIPRATDSQLRSNIKLGELQVEEASKKRDVILAALQLKRANKIGLLDKLKVVREKERACKEIYQKKRMEIDPLQAALNKFKFADIKFREDEIFSEEDLDNKISRLQHRIQHESISLKEEKQLIREIKQLGNQRVQACANDAEHALLLENFGPKEDLQEHLVILYRELDDLRAHQSQARLECVPIEKELEDFNIKIDELVEQLEAAKRLRTAALTAVRELKKTLGEQNAKFYRNKDDIRKAKELAASKNLGDLAALCHEQVENQLRCWNSDSGFRERYMKNNERSTLRRLETLDGRSLGPDEEPVLLMSDIDLLAENPPKTSESPGLQQKEIITTEALPSARPGNEVKKPQVNDVKLQSEKVLEGASGSSAPKKEKTKSEEKVTQNLESTRPPSVSTGMNPIEDATAKEAKAAELKEKRRQEEIAKAQEAAERKRRQAERAQAKAQLRAQKDAERREKERERKARKKTVTTEDVKKPVEEVPTIEERKRELVMEEVGKDSVKGFSSSSQGKKGASWAQPPPPKSRRRSSVAGALLSKRRMWQVSSSWLWATLAVLGTGLAVVFVTRF